MEIIIYLSLLSLVMLALLVTIFFWANANNQHDDLEDQGRRLLHIKERK